MHSNDDLTFSFPFPPSKNLLPPLPQTELFLTQVRKYVYRDADNLDTAFDAGGKVSIGLTATTIVSQWTWSATLLQSSTVASKVNILENNERLFWNIELRNWSWRPEAVGWWVGGCPSPTTKSFPLLISDAFWLSSYLPRKGSGSVLCRVLILFGFLISIVKEF